MDAHYIQRKSAHTNANYRIRFHMKPIAIYYFLDPLCSECWLADSLMKKLSIEYGRYIHIRPIISHIFNDCTTNLKRLTEQPIIDLWNKYYISISIIAASLQGNRAGRSFLRHIQQSIFFHYDDLQSANQPLLKRLITQAARKANLDLNEFYHDIFSDSVEKAYQRDLQLKYEMDVHQYPAFVFFSHYIDDYGIKVTGIKRYETYEYILKEMLQSDSFEQYKPSLIETFQCFKTLQTEEVAFIYDYSLKEAERQIKKLQLMQIVRKIEINGFRLWEYCG